MKRCALIVLISCSVYLANAYLPKPDFIYPCSKSHNFKQCAVKNAELTIPHILQGNRKYRIPKLVPLLLPIIDMPGTNNFHLQLKNVELHGLDKVSPRDIDIDFVKRKMDIEIYAKRIVILGDYTLKGRMLILPINGFGRVNITLIDGLYTYNLDYELATREGKEYLNVTRSHNDYKLQGINYDFQNLFNGDATLSRYMNNVLNENWRIVNADLKNSFRETLRIVPYNILKYIYTEIPFNELFVD